ncbi:electron transport complex subunit RsxC [Cronobacter dublinensis subsp. dublinensis]|nr:electron transport complex subunit RsxC [Cronobacter dublinensis subsp. dublinensis]EGT5668586.1 electron transport complex subunit RsxC [Cronobacter dublinensis subsp. dublinensis]EGT5671791.1 electron transport complex subunit RsxC [Cronobacter dublinensis subsp. dublinensis]EGT5689761.1 electron transport complex subunit RsxC [Cronobacter dublinensis subsp. dublinensis]EGT5698732.1 electron transport complex subunit RsxC [Cronobacter dublinensis subsp. dublinensis]
MLKLFSAFRKEKVWDFNGGIHPPEMKTQSNGTPLRQLPLPGRFIIPLKQHIGNEGEICVAPGDKVLRGQPLTVGRGRMLPVHAPTSGTVTAIMPHPTAHPSALPELSVIIDADGEDRWIARDGWSDYQSRSREALIERIHAFGVAGLGGAGFPTGTKLQGGGDKIETLIINAAECEPYITADDRLMQDCAAQIIDGVRILAHILQPREVLIGIEDNKPQAISMMRAVLHGEHKIRLRVIPTKYPSGGAKQLTQILTGKQVPHGGRSSDIGVLMQNVGTAFAVKRAIIDGEPLTERVVTLTGEAVGRPGNVWARIGTPVRHLLEHAGFIPTSEQLVIMGGPLMGFTLPGLDVPVVKITNCLLAPSAAEMGAPQEEQHCIRCSACADACPADLLPQQLYWFSVGQQHDKATAHNLADCIECGACAYVCPSNIPLVQYFRQEKAEIRAIAEEQQRAAEAKARFEARQLRLEREKAARLERHKKSAAQPSGQDQDAIQAALARVREKKADDRPIVVAAGEKPDNSAVIAAREARKAEARARQAEKVQQEMAANSSVPAMEATEPVNETDPRKAAVEAAIARAKARKAAQAGESAPVDETPAEPVDPRKAAVEAAIARAKARKAAQAGGSAPVDETPAESVDPRKAAVEAAIARAKARKAAQTGESAPVEQTPAEPVDPRKAAVEAAIARAKARKDAQAGESAPVAETPAEPVDPRKAAVEAAIARAKARKAAQAGESAPVAEAPAEPVDPRKAAVEAAIARAKARKAAQADERAQVANEEDDADSARKAAVAAAIARVQARKAADKVVNED